MRKNVCFLIAASVLFGIAGWLSQFDLPLTQHAVARADEAGSEQLKPQPVVDSMHQFMEYVFEPTYKRLKMQMAQAPEDKNAWKEVKSSSLILAEGGNLLLIRTPKEDAQEWNNLSTVIRDLGGQLYLASRKRDYKAAHQHYTAMLEKCNACHKKFAKGKHQLKP